MRIINFVIAILLSVTTGAQKISIGQQTLKIVSIDPSNKRIFISFDSHFNDAARNDEFFLENLHLITDTLERYVACLFKLQNISFFANSIYAKYRPLDKREYSEWVNEYLGEYDVINNEYTTYPALKKKSRKLKL